MSDTLERLRKVQRGHEINSARHLTLKTDDLRALLNIAEAAQALAPLFRYSSTYQRDPDFHAKAYVLLQTLAALDSTGGAER